MTFGRWSSAIPWGIVGEGPPFAPQAQDDHVIALKDGYRKLYHFHINKCGGTALNGWLDMQAADHRTPDPAQLKDLVTGSNGRHVLDIVEGWSAFAWFDVVHGHGPLRAHAPPGTFAFTVLRDPVQRLISQVHDWRRLNPDHYPHETPEMRATLIACRSMPLGRLLATFGHVAEGSVFDNIITRRLAACRMGPLAERIPDATLLLRTAIEVLEDDFDFVGLTEEMELSRNALCALAGLPPAESELGRSNVTRTDRTATAEELEAAPQLEAVTRLDRQLYDHARTLFDWRHREAGLGYGAAEFEALHAARLLGTLEPVERDGASCHSVRGPVFGSGFHGRDSARLPQCAIWTGPSPRTVLYVPVPVGRRIDLLLWIRGYANPDQRGQLRVFLDGCAAAHHFEAVRGCADLLVVRNQASCRPFQRLELELDETVPGGTPGTETHDPRLRGLSFDAYGWRPTRRTAFGTYPPG